MLSFINQYNEQILYQSAKNDPIFSCRIISLYQCYKDFPDIAKFYHNEYGGLLCLLEGSMFICGEHNGDELLMFCKLFSVVSISGQTGKWCESFSAYSATQSTVMVCDTTKIPPNDDFPICCFPEKRTVYNILCCEQKFAAQTSPLYWISDLTTRQKNGTARLYTIDQMATAGVYFLSNTVGILAGVAVLPAHRGKGMAAALVCHIARMLDDEDILPVVIAAEAQLEALYQKLGFSALCQHSYIELQ